MVTTTAPARSSRPSARRRPVTRPSTTISSSASPSMTERPCGLPDRGLHRGGIELPVGLGARTADRRALAAIEHAKLDAAGIGDPAHQTIQRVDLADQMALAETADGGIAGHRADGGETVRHQSGRRAHPGRRSRGLTAGVAAANHDDVEALSLCSHGRTSSSEAGKPEVETGEADVSRETGRAEPGKCFRENNPMHSRMALGKITVFREENGPRGVKARSRPDRVASARWQGRTPVIASGRSDPDSPRTRSLVAQASAQTWAKDRCFT